MLSCEGHLEPREATRRQDHFKGCFKAAAPVFLQNAWLKILRTGNKMSPLPYHLEVPCVSLSTTIWAKYRPFVTTDCHLSVKHDVFIYVHVISSGSDAGVGVDCQESQDPDHQESGAFAKSFTTQFLSSGLGRDQ